MKFDVIGTGRDIVEEIHEAIARRFGPYDDIREIIVKENLTPPTEIAQRHEKDFIRDDTPLRNAEETFVGCFGEVRADSLVARWANAGSEGIRLNTWISDARWALALFDTAKSHAIAGRTKEAMEAAARAGFHVAKMCLNGVMGAANQKDGWNRGTHDTKKQSAYQERDIFISDKNAKLLPRGEKSKRKRAKQIAKALRNERQDLPQCGFEYIRKYKI